VQDLSDLDIGIMPLPDSEWERGKCGLKALQYMALGIPTVASPVGVNREIIRHGQNGFLASSETEWRSALERLLDDAALRERMGAAGRTTVESGYSAAVQAPRVASILHAAAI
jgi:glycosyltransferase involved in cell wall biosynthesis